MSNVGRTQLGFGEKAGGAHTSRTIMLAELESLFESVPIDASKERYAKAIIEENCLAKRSGRTRALTFRHLVDLYSLNPELPVFSGFRYFWDQDLKAHGQLALLAASARDPLLRAVTPKILRVPEGTIVTREQVEEMIREEDPDRFSRATLKSTAQNINSSLTKSGHLTGRVKKVRQTLAPSPAVVGYALYLGWLEGYRGEFLFKSRYCDLLESREDSLMDFAAQASTRGWLVFKRAGDVVELSFPKLKAHANQETVSE